ncbi:hypothetical protein F5Y12DRAFT_710642 [Xylaria sp. FL1777]|nr:hypothetical protein F5Y12DRAFT_710642 [Xylaria sp. FL1777]
MAGQSLPNPPLNLLDNSSVFPSPEDLLLGFSPNPPLNLLDNSPIPSPENPPPGTPPNPPPDDEPGEIQEPPLYSPWTARWESRDNPVFIWENTIHTGLAPEFPRIDDPVQYLDTYSLTNLLISLQPRPSNEELDILFRTESYQSEKLLGMLTWQATSLHRWVNFSPGQIGPMSGGHLPGDVGEVAEALANAYDLNKIRVDESRWFRFMQKRRWYDWIETAPPGKNQGRTWSVDNPRVWRELSICLELVDRMLKALIEDKNEAAPWGEVVPPILGERPFRHALVILSYRMEQRIAQINGKPCEYDHIPQLSRSQWRQRLSEILATHLWGFIDDHSGSEARDICPTGYNFTSITLLTCSRLDTLMNTQLTIAERCAAQVNVSVSILHELCHAIFSRRFQNYLPPRVYRGQVNRPKPTEPYVDCEGITELGHNMEHRFFGGSLSYLPIEASISLAFISHEIPNVLRKEYNGIPGDWQNVGAIIRGCFTPASWTSKLLSEAFWKDVNIPQKSANYFHRPFTFTNSSVNVGDRPRYWGEVQVDPDALGAFSTISETDKMVVRTWNERKALWKDFRGGWYEFEKFKWKASPWSRVPYVININNFANAFAERDEIKCARIATRLANIVNWGADQNVFLGYMPQNDSDLTPSWIFHCIATPIRLTELKRRTTHSSWSYSTYPSRRASAGGHRGTICLGMNGKTEIDSCPPSVFYNQILDTGRMEDGFTQFDYLELAVSVVTEIARYAPAYFNWVGAIVAAYHALVADREAIQARTPNSHQVRWASNWPFKIPTYDEHFGRFRLNEFSAMAWDENRNLVFQ